MDRWEIKQHCMIIFIIAFLLDLAYGVIVMTKFEKTHGNGTSNLKCARNATARGFLATTSDVSNTCTSLDWQWGASLDYVNGLTYLEKKKVVEIYPNPVLLDGTMRLPIVFKAGASINMYIEFTRADFDYGNIYLVNTLDGPPYDLYSGFEEIMMIYLTLRPLNDEFVVKTFCYGWLNRAFVNPYPFPVGSSHMITFKALETEYQVLIGGIEVATFGQVAPPTDARMLDFLNVGMLLHRIEFIGV